MMKLLIALVALFVIVSADCVPLYRYWNGKNDHFYTTSADEIGTTTAGATGKYGYVSEGISCYIFSDPEDYEGIVPLYRYFNGHDHFYTTSEAEIGTITPGATGNYGYKFEGIQGYVFGSYNSDVSGLFLRYYDGGNGDHFYTLNVQEIGTNTPGATGNYGYKFEGTYYVIGL